MFAVEAFAAGEGKGADYQVANLEVFDQRPDFVDMASKFVAHDEIRRGGLVAAENMELTSTECCFVDFDDDVGWLFDLWNRSVFEDYLARPLEDDCLHRSVAHNELGDLVGGKKE